MTVDLTGIDTRPNGKHRVRFTERGKRKSKTFVDLDTAIRFRDAVFRAVASVQPVVLGMTVQQGSHAFLAKRKHLRDHGSDVSRWRRHIEGSTVASRDIATLSRRDILDWRDALDRQTTRHRYGNRPVVEISRSSKKHAINLLRRFLEYCVDRELLPANPARGVRIEQEGAPIPDDWFLTVEEQGRLAACPGWERDVAVFAFSTGLRQAEQWSLRIIDVHLDGDDPHVFVRFGAAGKTPKNTKARVVPLLPNALGVARRWLEQLPRYLEGKRGNPAGLMFPTPRGHRRGKSKVPIEWPAMREAVGRHVHWHLLRHTFASSLVAGWWGRRWALEEVRQVMGHSSITVTERYAHLARTRVHELGREAREAWDHGTKPGPIETQKPGKNTRESDNE